MNEHKERPRQQEFINKMVSNGYELFVPNSYDDIKSNLKKQLEDINELTFSDNEFSKIYDLINQGTIFDRSFRLLRELDISLDSGETKVIRLLNKKSWCQNNFQIAQEVETNKKGTDGKTARFDSVIFINGLPLVIMEFKQSSVGKDRGIEQIMDYQKDGKMHDLFLYCQIFIASSFSTTRYFANNNKINKEFIFKWTDKDNNEISNLIDGDKTIYNTLLGRCFIAEMIVRYMIRKENDKVNIILRPYQVYATKKILEKVDENNGNGYVFHTTGSGKTITSFKTCKLLTEYENIDKVIFLVDRKDLDAQTKSAYDDFEKGCYDNARNTNQLKKNILSNSSNIVVGTIQKMIRAIDKMHDDEKNIILNKRLVIIIDECHRSQSDTTTNTLRKVFTKKNAQYFGFTGTPIFEENSKTGPTHYKTTESVFGDELHRYSITNAVADNNVLQFNISQPKEIKTEKVDFLDLKRIKNISKYIIDNYDSYTDKRNFNTIFATASKEQLKLYYNALKEYNKTQDTIKQIKFTCIFSTNPDDTEEFVDNTPGENEFVSEVIEDYNNAFTTNINEKDIEMFKNKVYEATRSKELDLVLVVNMLLTGFDSPLTKTLFVDKNLKYHTLLQAYSRVNRKSKGKGYGNVVTFIEQKEDRDEALKLFSAGGTHTDFEIESYENLINNFNTHVELTQTICPDGDTLRQQLNDAMQSGNTEDLKESIEAIKTLQRQYSFIKMHPDFKEEDINISKKELNDLKDVYKEVYKSINGAKGTTDEEKPEMIQMDFEIGLFDEDRVNVEYLLSLTQGNLNKNVDINKIKEDIQSYDIPLEIREALIQAVDVYDISPNEDIGIYVQKELEKNKYSQYYDYANKNEIKDIEKFIELAMEQEKGNISYSQSDEYYKIKDLSFSKRRKFANETYKFVEETSEAYNIDK